LVVFVENPFVAALVAGAFGVTGMAIGETLQDV